MRIAIDVGEGTTAVNCGQLVRSVAPNAAAAGRIVTLGPGFFDFSMMPWFVHGDPVVVRGAGRDATVLVGRNPATSSFSCAFESAGRDVTFEDLTLESRMADPGGQSCVVGYANSATAAGAKLTIRRCRVLGGMFGVYSWKAADHQITIEDSEVAAGCFPVGAGRSSGADGQHVVIRRCVIRGDAALRLAAGSPDALPAGQDETYSTVHGIYLRGGTMAVYDTLFDLRGHPSRHGCLGIGMPSNASEHLTLDVHNCVFRIDANGALRARDIETQNPAILPNIRVHGGTGHEGGKVKVVNETDEHIEQ